MAALWVLPLMICSSFIRGLGVGAGWWLPGQDRRGPSAQIRMNHSRAASGSLCDISSWLPDRADRNVVSLTCPLSSEWQDNPPPLAENRHQSSQKYHPSFCILFNYSNQSFKKANYHTLRSQVISRDFYPIKHYQSIKPQRIISDYNMWNYSSLSEWILN